MSLAYRYSDMPEIIPNQEFKHGSETYAKGERYEVSEEDAKYFEDVGWVGGDPELYDGYAYNGEHSLNIHDGLLGHSAEVN